MPFRTGFIWVSKLTQVSKVSPGDIIGLRDRDKLILSLGVDKTTHVWSDLESYTQVQVSEYFEDLTAWLQTEQGKRQLHVYKAVISQIKMPEMIWGGGKNLLYERCKAYLSDPEQRDDWTNLFLTSIVSDKHKDWYALHLNASLNLHFAAGRVQCLNQCHSINTLILLPFLRTKYPNILHVESIRHTACSDVASKRLFDLSGFHTDHYEELFEEQCSFAARDYDNTVKFVSEECWLLNQPTDFIAQHGAFLPVK
jgi:hypothetical protein